MLLDADAATHGTIGSSSSSAAPCPCPLNTPSFLMNDARTSGARSTTNSGALLGTLDTQRVIFRNDAAHMPPCARASLTPLACCTVRSSHRAPPLAIAQHQLHGAPFSDNDARMSNPGPPSCAEASVPASSIQLRTLHTVGTPYGASDSDASLSEALAGANRNSPMIQYAIYPSSDVSMTRSTERCFLGRINMSNTRFFPEAIGHNARVHTDMQQPDSAFCRNACPETRAGTALPRESHDQPIAFCTEKIDTPLHSASLRIQVTLAMGTSPATRARHAYRSPPRDFRAPSRAVRRAWEHRASPKLSPFGTATPPRRCVRVFVPNHRVTHERTNHSTTSLNHLIAPNKMSNDATTPSNAQTAAAATDASANGSADKGKGKVAAEPVVADESMDEDDEDDEEEEEEDEDMEEDEDLQEIDPSVILAPGRRTRGVKVDYTSKEALAKAGLNADDADDDAEESFVARDDEMHDD
ncbi:hypothetical protein EVG20_g5352 [Dentipellis fragilis]|uniref:Histone chaperone domain-containing protein n=1 Tax=Dentipellis fragilis TaxID=205917 RepID=A0A4Y9YTL6_9AGAM|nr:hypothetical protein EVG20_g5352 [Dentipellis fragilis]